MSIVEAVIGRHRIAMATRLPNVLGFNWGWYSREEPKMHIQVLDGRTPAEQQLKVWLEERGTRCFKVASGNLSSKDLKTLKSACESKREFLDQSWTVDIMGKGWVKADLGRHSVTVTCYPQSQHRFTRQIDLVREFPGHYQDGPDSWDRQEIHCTLLPKYGALAVGPEPNPEDRAYIRLADWLWQDG